MFYAKTPTTWLTLKRNVTTELYLMLLLPLASQNENIINNRIGCGEKFSSKGASAECYVLEGAVNKRLQLCLENDREAKSCLSTEVSFRKRFSLSLCVCVCAHVYVTPVIILVSSKSGFRG